MRKLLISGVLSVALFAAGSTSVNVPVTIDYTAGCAIKNLPDTVNIGSVLNVMSNRGKVLDPIGIDVICIDGTSYTVSLQAQDATVGSSSVQIDFCVDEGCSVVGSRSMTANGAVQSISFYPKVLPKNCTDLGNYRYECETGTFTTPLTVTVTW